MLGLPPAACAPTCAPGCSRPSGASTASCASRFRICCCCAPPRGWSPSAVPPRRVRRRCKKLRAQPARDEPAHRRAARHRGLSASSRTRGRPAGSRSRARCCCRSRPPRATPPPRRRSAICARGRRGAAAAGDVAPARSAREERLYDDRLRHRGDRPGARRAQLPAGAAPAPAHADAHVNLGRLLHEAAIWPRPRRTTARARMRPDDATAAFNLGVALEDQGRDGEALEPTSAPSRLDGQNADAHYNAARLYEKMGNYSAAMRHLRAYRDLDPGAR